MSRGRPPPPGPPGPRRPPGCPVKGSRTRPLLRGSERRTPCAGPGLRSGPSEHFQVPEPAELVAGHRGHRAGVPQHVGDLFLAVDRHDRDQDRADPGQRRGDHGEFGPVGKLHGNPVSRAHTLSPQAHGQPQGLVTEAGVRQRRGAIEDEDLVTPASGLLRDQRVEAGRPPVARGIERGDPLPAVPVADGLESVHSRGPLLACPNPHDEC